MNKKYKILLILFALVVITLGSGLTYSFFTSGASLNVENQDIAKFVFDANMLDNIEIPLTSINPSDIKEYEFAVANNKEISNATVTSNVTLQYQIELTTYHFMPLIIELYKGEDLIMTCDESYSRNETNKLVCNSDIQEMSFSNEIMDYYTLKISFPSEYNTEEYANLVDFIDLEISSWQRVNN